MPRIDALRKMQAELVKRGEANLAAARKDSRVLTVEERTAAEKIQAELDGVRADLRIEQGQMDAERDLRDGLTAAGDQAPSTPKPFRTIGDQLRAVVAHAVDHTTDPRLLEVQAGPAGMNEAVAGDGGFLVQQDFSAELLRLVYETGILPGRCRRLPIGPNSNGMKINAVNETSRATGSRWGGVQAYWAAEAGTKTPSAPKLRQISIDLKKLIGLCYATDELLQDAVALDGWIRQAFTEEFGFQLDDAIYAGDGAGKPMGATVCPARVTVAKEAGQAAATIVAENIEKMYARILPQSLSRAEWYINQECWPQLFKLSHAVGTGGVPMFVPAGGLSNAPAGTLLGRPIVPIEQASALGTEGDLSLLDLQAYLLAEKGGMQAATSIHVKFVTDETAFRFVVRVDGQPIPIAPITPYKGTATLSPFVTLATRA